jgi:hypothetical protein
MKEANSNPENRRTEFMTTSPYSTMDIRQVEKLLAGLSIAALALESFHASDNLLEAHAPERAKALLEKVLGEHTKYAWIKLNDKFRPAFEVDGIGLEFTQGATADDDIFTVSYAGASSWIPVRSFTALGLAVCDCITTADGSIILDEAVAKVYDQIEGEFAVLKIAEEFIL